MKYNIRIEKPEDREIREESIYIWLERDGRDVVLYSMKEGSCDSYIEARFTPNGLMNIYSQGKFENFKVNDLAFKSVN